MTAVLQADLTMEDVEEEAAGRPIYRECRACLRIGKSCGFVDIFLEKDPPWPWSTDRTVADELVRIAQVPIFGRCTEKCSDVICFSCLHKLRAASEFVAIVQNSDQVQQSRYINRADNDQNCPMLKQMMSKDGRVGTEQNCAEKQIDMEQLNNISQLHNEKQWPQPKQVEREVNEVLLGNPMEIEIKQEIMSEEENDASEEEGEDGVDKPEFLMDIKIEPEEIVNPNPIHVTVNGTITMDQMKDMPNGCEIYYDEEYLTDYIKEEPISDEEEAGVDLPLECMLCTKRFLCVSGLKAHVVAYHSYKSVRRKTRGDSPAKPKPKQRHICDICRRCFWTLTDLMVHETCHNKLSCYGCQGKFDDFRELTKHRQRCQACNARKPQVKTLKDSIRPLTKVLVRRSLVACTKCPEKFTDEHYLKVHDQNIHSSSKTQTDNDEDKREEDKSRIVESKNVEDEERDNKLDGQRITEENKSVGEREKDNNKMETESLELEMLKIHEGADSVNSNNECRENIETQNKGPDQETANDKIPIDKPMNNEEEPDKINEIVIEVNVTENVSDSKNVNEKVDSPVKMKTEAETMDNEAKDGTNVNKNDDVTNKLGPVEDIERAQKNMIEIEIETARSLKHNKKQELDDTYQCSMMQTDSY